MSARYGTDEYTSAIQSLFPVGRVWPRASDSVMTTLIRALAAAYRQNDADAVQLLVDAFPKTASALLPEWEATLGLPDDCACNASSDEALRRQAVVSKLIGSGGQSAAYFISLAEAMGYGISIKQYRQARAGLSVCGDALNGDRWPYVWEATVTDVSNDATCSLKLLLCRLSEFSPAHTKFSSSYDVSSLYGIGIALSLVNGILSGTVTGTSCIDVADVDITLIYTLPDGSTVTERLVTDAAGQFSTVPDVGADFTVVARAQVLTPLCEWENVESGEVI
ncbi:YmfQ family protein, partial [Brenneria nigrifluens]